MIALGSVVPESFTLYELAVPIIAAPMAGGPSTPALAAAASNGGGLGFLAAGLQTVATMANELEIARTLTSGPLGVNLFVPQTFRPESGQLERYAAALSEEARRYGVELGRPHAGDDDEWDDKVDALCDLRPEVVSFTFGAPSWEVCRRLKSRGIMVLTTVTTANEAAEALAGGADGLIAQGPWAGGHRATFDQAATPSSEPLTELVTKLLARFRCAVVAAGGLAEPAAVSSMLRGGAAAVQLGTAFLLADEAGTNPVHRSALVDPQFTRTVLTRAFTGRYARGLRNRFVVHHDHHAIIGFPDVGRVTAPLLAAAVAAGDPHGTSLWAGQHFRKAQTRPTVDIMHALAGGA
jgi:nitronate monooxygenase